MITDDDPSPYSIDPGGVNSDRTKAKCQECETVFQFDPAWTPETTCPSCEEGPLFCYVCEGCQYHACYGSTEPAFPNMPCAECGRTEEEREEESQADQRRIDEQKRVSNGASFRAAKIGEPFPVDQNNIMLTRRALYGQARPGAPPVSEGDALRMSDEDWAILRPLVAAELGDDAEKILTVNWCRYQINVFERSLQSSHMGELERGLIEDWTGKPYHLGLGMYALRAGLRGLREAQLEEGCMPIAPAVKIDEEAWGKTAETRAQPLKNFLSWEDLPGNFDQDPREIYKSDGNKTLTLFEFLVWSARVGGFARQDPNPKWNIESCTPRAARYSTVEPVGYVPTDWVGRPKSFAEDKGRWHWVRKQLSKGDFEGVRQLETCLAANMRLCSMCYGPPKEGRTDLILCECETVYWCGEECKKKAWALHSLDHRVRHSTDVKRTCLSCGKGGGNELMRCSRCQVSALLMAYI
jgi:hypothetical protein